MTKLCKDCAYFRDVSRGMCAASGNALDVLYGLRCYTTSAYAMRRPGRECGEEGKLFKKRKTWWLQGLTENPNLHPTER